MKTNIIKYVRFEIVFHIPNLIFLSTVYHKRDAEYTKPEQVVKFVNKK